MVIQEKQKKGGCWELWKTKSCSFLIEPSGPGGSIFTLKQGLCKGQAWCPGKPELNYSCLTKEGVKEKMP